MRLDRHKNPKASRLRPITLPVTVTGATLEAAARLAQEYAPGERLEEVLTAFVDDLATAADRPGSWESDRVTAWLSSHPWPKQESKEGRCHAPL